MPRSQTEKREIERMTLVKVEINNDGKYCDICKHLEYDDVNKKNCCMLFGEFVESIGEKPYYSDTKDIRCNKCIEAELAIGGIS
jgi:hypothetical protein